jgi:thiosulfate/3-mercaptopyruvate sulfurtransferase
MPNDDEWGCPDLLADPAWLWHHREDADLRVIDCGSVTPSWEPGEPAARDDFERAHIPGALPLNVHNWIKDPGRPLSLLGAERFAAAMEALGVSATTTVVAYDRVNGLYAARLWWALAYYGHDRTRVLDGGLAGWLAEGRPVTARESAAPDRGRFVADGRPALRCERLEIQDRLHEPDFHLLDTRSDEEFVGTKSAGNHRVGHIPGAVHLDWKELVVAAGRPRLRPAGTLDATFDAAGLRKGDEIVTYCQAGVRAAFAAFVLTALGWPRVRVYDESMAEWANRNDTPLTAAPGVERHRAA